MFALAQPANPVADHVPTMTQLLLKLSCLLCALLFASTSAAAQAETTLFAVRVARPDGTRLAGDELDYALHVSVHGHDELGWPVKLYLSRERAGPAWREFHVPRGVELRLSIYAPPHPLLERVIELDPDAVETRVDLTLAAPVPMRSLGVVVNFPPSASSWPGSFRVQLLAPGGGHLLKLTDVAEARGGLRVAEGTYEVLVEAVTTSWCGVGAPSPEWMVPTRKTVVVKDTGAKADGRNGVWVTFDPECGSRLKLHVLAPDPGATKSKLEPLDSPAGNGRLVIGQRFAGDEQQRVRVRLERIDGGGIYDLTWGWAKLGFIMPWDHFPMGEDVYQIVPVPSGEYVLVLRGSGIEELRRKITLVDDEVLKLELQPQARR